jgi:hypothetical protein
VDGRGVEVTKWNFRSFAIIGPFVPMGRKKLHWKIAYQSIWKCTTDHISMAGPWLFPRTFR